MGVSPTTGGLMQKGCAFCSRVGGAHSSRALRTLGQTLLAAAAVLLLAAAPMSARSALAEAEGAAKVVKSKPHKITHGDRRHSAERKRKARRGFKGRYGRDDGDHSQSSPPSIGVGFGAGGL